MLVSWNWLKDYVKCPATHEDVALKLAMSGLNHEGTEAVGDDQCIDLEVTSNRGDCLGHVGVAREIAVLWDLPLTVDDPQPKEGGDKVEDAIKVTIETPLCPRYTARVIKGVKVGPSPQWLVDRLATIGINSVNNIVDITNYVMMECGQPLHAFDLAQIRGGQIIVRAANKDEEFEAIDHRSYKLTPNMCVIADAERSVALGGVMGGVDSEVTDSTVDVLVEAATFEPLSIRTTARALKLHSPSSYRFERNVDWEGIDWASRRCCELILELAGGELMSGVVDTVHAANEPNKPVEMRFAQVQRILGISVPSDEVLRILEALGCEKKSATSDSVTVTPPSWRHDLPREIDLIEEVARIHGYDKIPEDVGVPMAPSYRQDSERVMQHIRRMMTSSGFDEAMTASVVTEDWSNVASPWTSEEAIQSSTPMLEGADRLRRSVVPSLLGSRRRNENLSNANIELFETAKVYLPNKSGLPEEPWMLALTSGRDFLTVKGILATLIKSLNSHAELETADCDLELLDADQRCEVICNGEKLGYLGVLAGNIQKSKTYSLRAPTVVAELRIAGLEKVAQLIPQYRKQSAYPPVTRDMNLILDEAVRWADVAKTVQTAAGDMLDQLQYREIYRDAAKDGAGKKRMMFSFRLRSDERTLTGEEADKITGAVIKACESNHAAKLVS